MIAKKTCICNANIILPDGLLKGHIVIEGDRIARISAGNYPRVNVYTEAVLVDAEQAYVMPGMIDIHSDAIEKEIQPRPNTLFPVPMAFYELEKKLAGSGITTMYHSLSLSDEWGVRDKEMVVGMIDAINHLKRLRAMIHHKIHLRYEITFLEGLETLEKLIRNESIDFMSYMDHTPGQGQFKDSEALKSFTMQAYGTKEKDVEDLIDRTKECQEKIDWDGLKALAKLAKSHGIGLASHDDDSRDKIETLLECRGMVSEFPINLETALYAKQKGLHVCVGAPNLVRGKSHSNNMRAIDAVKNGAADIICSDYLPSAMLPAVFKLTLEGVGLSDAVNMVTLNPAKALGIDRETGSLDAGKRADMMIVELCRDYPIVRKVFSGGVAVYQADYQLQNVEGVENVC